MKICKCLCAAIALGVIACYANNAYASEPNLSLNEKVALRMASAPGNAAIQDSAVKEIEKGKVTLRKANASGKYAQGADVTFFGLNDDSEETQEQLGSAEKEINSRTSDTPNANAIKWWTPTSLKKDGPGDKGPGDKGPGDKGPGDKGSGTGVGEGGGWIDCWDPICCCCCVCQPVYPYVTGSTDCGCGSYEIGCDAGCYDFGCGYIDDYPCSYECDEICGSARPCRVRTTISRVISRVGAWR